MPISHSAAATLAAPTGWRWERRPDDYYGTGILMMHPASSYTTAYGANILSLSTWAQEHNVEVGIYNHRGHLNGRVANTWSVQITNSYFDWFSAYTCSCGTAHTVGDMECSGCGQLKCAGCQLYGLTLAVLDDNTLACPSCRRQCSCGRHHSRRYTACSTCSPRTECAGGECTQVIELSNNNAVNGSNYCRNCFSRLCTRCSNTRGTERHPVSGNRLCPECFAKVDLESSEYFDDSADLSSQRLIIEATAERPVRVCSIEQEFCGGNGAAVGNSLHQAGLSPVGGVADYHYPPHNYPCHVERDSSVNGGELIYNRMRLNTIEDATHMRNILNIFRDHQRAGRVQINVRAGLHIHVDLHGYNLSDARHLAMIFNYLEDPLYRLAAAQYKGHRVAISGNHHAMSPPKGIWKTNQRFGMDFLRHSGHNHALNLQHFYNAYRTRCTCGAGQFGEDWSLCECEYLGKCTAEWRVFNATSNPRKLHAYIALAQSATAWAQQREGIDADDFTPLEYNMDIEFERGESQAEQELIELWKPRLEWMFGNLYFSSSEKEDLLYCIRHSELQYLGETFIDRLAAITRTPENRTLEVRHPAQRGNPGDPITQAQPNINFQTMTDTIANNLGYYDDPYPEESEW